VAFSTEVEELVEGKKGCENNCDREHLRHEEPEECKKDWDDFKYQFEPANYEKRRDYNYN